MNCKALTESSMFGPTHCGGELVPIGISDDRKHALVIEMTGLEQVTITRCPKCFTMYAMTEGEVE